MTEHLIFGVDGLNHDFVQMLVDRGLMPNIKKLQQHIDTEYGEFESYICDGYDMPHTGPNWTSLYTGLKPQEHGITSGGWNDGDSEFHVMNTIWDELGDAGHEMFLYGMPMTYKAKEVNGKMVSGFISTTLKSMFSNCVSPESFEEDIPDDFIENTSSYVARVKTDGAKPSTDTDEFYSVLSPAENERLQTFLDVHDDEDIVAYGTTLVDKIGHVAGITEDSEKAREAYIFLDMILGELLEELEPTHVTIISDHGFSEFSHDLHGYFLDNTGRGMNSIFDFTPYMESIYGLENTDYGPTEEDNDLTTSEVDDIKKQLGDLGYF